MEFLYDTAFKRSNNQTELLNQDIIEDVISIVIYVIGITVLTLAFLFYFTKNRPLKIPIFGILFFSYFITFLALVLLPIDVASGLHATIYQKPRSAFPYMVIMWYIVYWSIQGLAWVFIPICQSYVLRGEFSFIRRIIGSIFENILLYLILGILCVIIGFLGLIWIIYNGKFSISGIVGLCTALSNAFGLIMLCFFLGYGVVKLPKRLWNIGNNERNLSYIEFRSAELFDKVDLTQETFEKYLSIISALEKYVKDENDELNQHDDEDENEEHDENNNENTSRLTKKNKKFISILVKKYKKFFKQFDIQPDQNFKIEKYQKRRDFEKLHKNIHRSHQNHIKYEYEFEYLKKQAFFLEDVIDSSDSSSRVIHSPFRKEFSSPLLKPFYFLEWLFLTKLKIIFYRILAILVIIFGVVIVLCQFTPFFQQTTGLNFSIFYWSIRLATFNKYLLQIISVSIILMIAVLVYYTLFDIKFLNFYRIIPHVSGPYELLYGGVFLCRVVPALCFNYMNLIGITKNDGVAFFDVMGTMKLKELQILGQIGGYFSDYFPIIIVLIIIVVFLNVGDRVLLFLGFEDWVFSETMSTDKIEDGRDILQRERRRLLSKKRFNKKLRDEDEEDDEISSIDDENKKNWFVNLFDNSIKKVQTLIFGQEVDFEQNHDFLEEEVLHKRTQKITQRTKSGEFNWNFKTKQDDFVSNSML